jgi:hypothetical protein
MVLARGSRQEDSAHVAQTQKSRRPPDSILDAQKKARVAATGVRAGAASASTRGRMADRTRAY